MNQGPYYDTSQYQGPPGSNPALRYDRARGRFLVAPPDLTSDSQKVLQEAKVGETRTFVRLWDLEGGEIAPFDPQAGWQRGQIIRGSQYQFVLTQLGPMRDPSDAGMRAQPAYWRPGL